jgi:hypothetical protein
MAVAVVLARVDRRVVRVDTVGGGAVDAEVDADAAVDAEERVDLLGGMAGECRVCR